MREPVVILGLGFTAQRLARRLRRRGVPVFAAVRRPERFAEFEALGVHIGSLTGGIFPGNPVLVHSIPPLETAENSMIHEFVAGIAPRRILFVSSAGVYGSHTEVDDHTPAAPDDDKQRARVKEEEWIAGLAVSGGSLILRSAAIYGPGRGVHVRLREGRLPRGAGIVSRIYVDDLAALLEAGAESGLAGAWPVADDCPAASEEVMAWCAKFMGMAAPTGIPRHFSAVGRRVDGRKVRELLGVELKHPSYRTGIPASLAEESEPGGGQ